MTGLVDLTGRTVVVTGAARGIGRAIADTLTAAGAHVVTVDLAGDVDHRLDVTDDEGWAALTSWLCHTREKVHGLVNNAGTTWRARLGELKPSDLRRVHEVNLVGPLLAIQHLVPLMPPGGSIVNIGSVSSHRPQPNNAAYVAAKHGVIGLSKVASLENAPRGIRVNTVCPGAIDTPMVRGALDTVGLTEEEFAPVISLFGRFGKPEEVAQASLWLCSDQSSYVTGAVLAVDAGYTSR